MSNPHDPVSTSYNLEKKLEESIKRMKDNVTRSHELRKQLLKVRKARRQIEAVPDEVKEWFEDTADYEEEADM